MIEMIHGDKITKWRYGLAMLAATAVPVMIGALCFLISTEEYSVACYRSFTKYSECLSNEKSLKFATFIIAICGYFLVIGGLIAGVIGTYKVFKNYKSNNYIYEDQIEGIAIITTLWAHLWLILLVTSDEFILGGPMRPGSWQLEDYFFSLPFVALGSIPFLAIAIPLGLLAAYAFKWVAYGPER